MVNISDPRGSLVLKVPLTVLLKLELLILICIYSESKADALGVACKIKFSKKGIFREAIESSLHIASPIISNPLTKVSRVKEI